MSAETEPIVDVAIAVHSATRPIARAVASVIDGTTAPVRVTVVAHNIDPEIIRTSLGPYATHPDVRLLPLLDGIPSPAGPKNHGLDSATAPFVVVLDSDDELEPGAVDSWIDVQRRTGAEVVLSRLVVDGSASAPLPPIRFRPQKVSGDAVRDRLSYRTAHLGLISRERFGHVRYTAGLRSGEDIAFSTEIWFTAAAVAIDKRGPGFLSHEDAVDRVTSGIGTVTQDFAFLDAVSEAGWFSALSRRQRTALVSKLLRIQFLGAITARRESITAHSTELRHVLEHLRRMAPAALGVLSRVDRKIIDEALSASPDPTRILELSHQRWNARSLGVLITRNPLRSLHSQAMFRLLRDARRVGVA